MAAEVGTNTKTRSYSETGSRVISYTGTTKENDFDLSSSASGVGATAVATGSYASGTTPVTVTGTATAPGATTGATTASVNVDSYELTAGSLSDVKSGTFTETISETLSSSFSF